MSEPRYLLILNPVSGSLDYGETRRRIAERVEELGIAHEIRETEGEGDARRWAREADGVTHILVGGGDGTVMEVMTGVIESGRRLPVAQLAMGTANLLARALAIPTDLSAALDLAFRDGVVIGIDVGYLEEHERYFALMAGSGWDARLIEDADRRMKNRLGFFAYVISGIRNLFRLEDSRVELTIDRETHRFRAHTVEVINVGEIYGSGIALGNDMSPHDGRLNIAIASTKTVFGLLRVFFRILTRNFDRTPHLRYYSASHIRVEADPPLPLQADGEPIGETPYEIDVVPEGVRLVAPRDYVSAKKIEFHPLFPSS